MKALFFKTRSCSGCKSMMPWIEEFDVEVIDLGFDTNRAYVDHYGLHSVPTIIVLDEDGSEVRRNIGAMTKGEFAEFVR